VCLGQTRKIKRFVQVRAVPWSLIACIIVGQAEKGEKGVRALFSEIPVFQRISQTVKKGSDPFSYAL
jgi:hypothetical protein